MTGLSETLLVLANYDWDKNDELHVQLESSRMNDFVEIELKPDTLEHHGLPNIPYPLHKSELIAALGQEAELPFTALLKGLQAKSAYSETPWMSLEPAMQRLAELVNPLNDNADHILESEKCWLKIAATDLTKSVITVQREDHLIASITPLRDGRLQISTYRPVDLQTADDLTRLGIPPSPDHGVCMRENNWEYALDCSAGNGNIYSMLNGQPYLSYWKDGLGISHDGAIDHEWYSKRELQIISPSQTLIELTVHQEISYQ